jgi:hypothetical protein
VSQFLAVVVDVVAIALLTFGVYFPRHHRRDLVAAFLGVNIGVLATATTLGSSTVGAGLGLGLFGVLSIIRLRSSEIAQHEVAYYFAALALGLLAGLEQEVSPMVLGLMLLVIAALWIGDHPRLFHRHQQRIVTLDSAFTDDGALRAHLEMLLKGKIVNLSVRSIDLVDDTTVVEVRYVLSPVREPVAA